MNYRVIRSDELYHYGILGMKWGVRRFQNPDGTRTEAGKKRYGYATVKKGSIKSPLDVVKNTSSDSHSDNTSDTINALIFGALSSIAVGAVAAAELAATGRVHVMLAVYALTGAVATTIGTAVAVSGVIKAKVRKSKYNKERKDEETDEATGFKKKSRDLSPEEDIKRVNPEYSNTKNNTKNNCMLCAATYELRRRGYDVRAKKASHGYCESDIKRWFKNAKTNEYYGGTKQEWVDAYKTWLRDRYMGLPNTGMYPEEKRKSIATNAVNKMTSYGEGARGILGVNWNMAPNSGHALHWEVKDNKVVISDAQTGKFEKNAEEFLSYYTCGATVTRLDNLSVVADGIQEVAE